MKLTRNSGAVEGGRELKQIEGIWLQILTVEGFPPATAARWRNRGLEIGGLRGFAFGGESQCTSMTDWIFGISTIATAILRLALGCVTVVTVDMDFLVEAHAAKCYYHVAQTGDGLHKNPFVKRSLVEDVISGSGIDLKALVESIQDYHSVLEENMKLYNEVQDLKG
ncbi:Uncharacterized protein Fot_26567 [Forsythia ovata]|uniref:Uncharacterized protein n=1 Tax=Forsythia ovata TaxID=205694 RepID=A0ABD1UC90_9LAMI